MARVLDGVSFAVERGRFTALLGPNGAGKTTLFSLITRLLVSRSGVISICGLDIRTAGARALAPLGIVFQQPTLDLDLTVRQNLHYFARLRGFSCAEAERRIERELTRLGMAERARETVRALNGGHRRRVEIARALLHDPQLLLLDEPTVGLDFPSRKAIVEHVHELAGDRHIGILWATHLIDEIRPTDDLVLLDKGRVVAGGVAADVVARSGAGSLDAAFTWLTAGKVAPG
jgi:ABC-2 type transport system ATP-binding protein